MNREPDLPQTQREAIVDLLLLAMYADEHLSLREEDQLQKKIHALRMEETLATELYLDQAIANVRSITSNAERTAFLKARAEQLGDAETKTLAYRKVMELFESDGLTGNESTLAAEMRTLLEIDG